MISTRDRPDTLEDCLRSACGQTWRPDEIVIVDSAPRIDQANRVAGKFGARYVLEHEPGLSRARNRGAREAAGDIIVFVDDDVTLEPGCVAALLVEFQDPKVSMVTGRLVLKGGDPEAREAFETFGAFDVGTERRSVDRESADWFELANFGGLGVGALLAVRRTILAEWPGFDERLGRGALQDCSEELLAFLSLVEGGHRIVYTPHALAHHPGPASLEALRQRLLAAAAGATAYMTLLFFEYPEYRRLVVAYAKRALLGRRRAWRSRPAIARRSVVSAGHEWLARVRGPFIYLRMRLAARRRSAPVLA